MRVIEIAGDRSVERLAKQATVERLTNLALCRLASDTAPTDPSATQIVRQSCVKTEPSCRSLTSADRLRRCVRRCGLRPSSAGFMNLPPDNVRSVQ